MMRYSVFGLLLLTGCDLVFGLDAPVTPDAGDCEPMGHDEDRDCLGDAEDFCPGIPSAQTDEDGDNVGDECDPFPNEPTTQVDFDAFVGVDTTRRWQPVPIDDPRNIAWSWDGESWTIDSLDDVVGRQLVLLDTTGPRTTSPIVVVAAFSVAAMSPEYGVIGIRIGTTADDTFAFDCSAIRYRETGGEALQAFEFGTAKSSSAGLELVDDQRILIKLRHEPGASTTIDCDAIIEPSGGANTSLNDTGTHDDGSVGLAVVGVRGKIEWITMYARTP